jgi:3-deoxy-D-manno-octulosonic-acid transferase
MNPSLHLYSTLIRGIVSILDIFPPKRLDAEEVALRKGLPQVGETDINGTIWVHGASLGEVITLRPLLKALTQRYGRDRILATAMTMDGLNRLRHDDLVGHTALLPLEAPEFLNAFLDRLQPALVILSETEIWPYFLSILHERGIPYGIANARINPKTVKLLKIFRPLFQQALDGISFVFPQNETYRHRFSQAGVTATKMQVLGCFKFDFLDTEPQPQSYRAFLGLPPEESVLCFGSTHPGEERLILEALRHLPESGKVTIVLAPRHINRVPEIELLLREFGVAFSRLSRNQKPPAKCILVDTLGDLRNLYALSVLAFVGGSLIPRGGHSLIEPAAFGVPIMTGPHTENFPLERAELVASQALIELRNPADLLTALRRFFADPTVYQAHGQRGREVLQRMSGSVARTVSALESLHLLPTWPTPS